MVNNQHRAADELEAMGKVNEELEALNSLVTVLVVVLQIIQTILKVMRPKLKRERDCKPHAVVVERGSSRGSGGTKKDSSSRKGSSSRRGASLPSKRLCTVLSLSTEEECEKSTKSTSHEPCTGSREECAPLGTHPVAFKRPASVSSSDSAVPALEMSKEMAASLKMLNCADVANRLGDTVIWKLTLSPGAVVLNCGDNAKSPLPSTAPLAVPHTPSKSKSRSAEKTKDSKEDKTKEDKKTKAPASVDLPVQATPTPTTQISTAAALSTAANASPNVQSTQRLSVAESSLSMPGPKKNSPVKTAKEEVKETPSAPAAAAAPPVTAMPPQQ
ncbi:hypothetical protein PRIPAC_86765 [Pristionchus pacificus]|uniref:Uncharacterized protein n=1 Tax=Pristionchus pacificus TaxID=54126 RepID=A0A2A6BMZ3_PRIPA|nr:hypothetical protein PRIPAC_86765 [Pristionchus pacificus]|eukprot:PDM67287.1 hypothetical protein PRIPAC_48704 [Pristionchus pacificus]